MERPFEEGPPITLPGVKNVKKQGDTAVYEIGPLDPGYGITIANALQRVLRSSLPGAAITALRVEGVLGIGAGILLIKETLSDLILNVKQVKLRCFSDLPVLMHLDVSGKQEVIASDITVPNTIEIINPNLHIAMLENEQARLALDLIAQSGRGYVPAEMQTELSTGFISIDAMYTPILDATYELEHTRLGKMVNFDKIIFSLKTDGTIAPDDAFTQGADILRQQFLMFTADPTSLPEDELLHASSTVLIPQRIYKLPLEVLNLPMRSYNSLKRKGVIWVGQVLTMSEEELVSTRNVGEKSILDIIAGLRSADCFPHFVEDAGQTQ